MSKHKQLLFIFFRELCNFFRALGQMFVCFYFCWFVPPSIDQTHSLHQVFLLIVCTTGVKIPRIFFESDEYLCPLIVAYSEEIWECNTEFIRGSLSIRRFWGKRGKMKAKKGESWRRDTDAFTGALHPHTAWFDTIQSKSLPVIGLSASRVKKLA